MPLLPAPARIHHTASCATVCPPADQQLDAVARQGPEQGEAPAERRFRQKAALRLQRKAEEAKAAQTEAALVRAKVVRPPGLLTCCVAGSPSRRCGCS